MSRLLIGYARVSTDTQDLTAQRDGLQALGVEFERIYVDHGLTGTHRDRPGLREALAACRAGDTLVVTKLDRLARALPDAPPRSPTSSPPARPAPRPSRRRAHPPPDQPLARRVGLRPHRRRRSPAVQRPSDGGRVRVRPH